MVEPREAYATGFSYRAVDDKGNLKHMHRGAGGIYVLERDSPPQAFAMAVMLSASGTAFPVLAEDFDPGGSAAVQALEGLRCSRAAGNTSQPPVSARLTMSRRSKRRMSWRPELEVDYDAMSLSPADWRHRRHCAIENGAVAIQAGDLGGPRRPLPHRRRIRAHRSHHRGSTSSIRSHAGRHRPRASPGRSSTWRRSAAASSPGRRRTPGAGRTTRSGACSSSPSTGAWASAAA